MKNKKAQVGTTLTWMIAFLVIFFIMLLFLVFTSALAAKNVLLVLNEGKNKIDISSSMNPLTSQRKLFYVLNYPLENNKTIKELIIFSSDETVKINIQKNATKILQTPDKIQNQEICYSFFIFVIIFLFR